MEIFSNTLTKLAIIALGTGLGIIIGNSIVKYFVHRHNLREAEKIFKSSVIEITGKYFSTLQKNLVNLKLFFSDRFSIGNSEKNFYWNNKEIILSTLAQFITQLEATIDRGAIAKIILDKKQKFKQKDESKKLAESFYHNTGCSRYCVREEYLSQQEFDDVKKFIDRICPDQQAKGEPFSN